MKVLKSVILILVLLAFFLNVCGRQANHTSISPIAVKTQVKIDGNLDETIWKTPTVDKKFITYNPMPGEILPQKTLVYVAYDKENLYFAFKCYDSEPGKIKTSITKRDSIFSDDWVGLSLDAFGNGQSAYDLFVNPNGIQGDIYTTVNNGEDISPDWVWESAGRMTDNGYQVEIKLPLKSIRYRGGKESAMRVLFWRRISRLGVSGSWPELKPGVGRFNVTAKAIFRNLKNERILEILPSLTASRNREKMSYNSWGKPESLKDLGVSLKYGITPSITTELTINPDFSQVESDSFQMMVNRRYPVFFSEKRPFFMESRGLFNIAGTGGDMMMYTAVHTRRIVDPGWGAKLTGTVGKTSFGVLTSNDLWPGQAWLDEINPDQGDKALFVIARGKTSLGGDNYFGAIYSRRDFAGENNQVMGGDLKLRLGRSHNMSLTALNSLTQEAGSAGHQSGQLLTLVYEYFSKSMGVFSAFESYGQNFRMDTAFYNRTGFNKTTLYLGPMFTPKSKKLNWVKRINPFFFGFFLHDLSTNMDDSLILFALRFNFIKQGYFRMDYMWDSESWVNRTFKQRRFRLMGDVQLTKWLHLGGDFSYGNRIFYDEEDPYMGKNLSTGFFVRLQPNSKFTESLSVDYVDFREPIKKERVYDALILNSKTTYQFNKHFFLRANLRYDSYYKSFLTDLLASFTLIPGTVVHVGYGSLHERRDWGTDEILPDPNRMIKVREGLFFKASYLWRI
jgi:hypothetical protein